MAVLGQYAELHLQESALHPAPGAPESQDGVRNAAEDHESLAFLRLTHVAHVGLTCCRLSNVRKKQDAGEPSVSNAKVLLVF